MLQELHREFKWPYPSQRHGPSPQPHLLPGHSPKPHPTARDPTTKLFSPDSTLHDSFSPPKDTPTDQMTPRAATPTDDDESVNSTERGKTLENHELTSSLKRINRPPDLNLSPDRDSSVPVELANQKLVGVAAVELLRSQGADFDPGRSSTPTKHSGSISERVSLVYKKTACEFSHMSCQLLSP